jgi:hypothetical protein
VSLTITEGGAGYVDVFFRPVTAEADIVAGIRAPLVGVLGGAAEVGPAGGGGPPEPAAGSGVFQVPAG